MFTKKKNFLTEIFGLEQLTRILRFFNNILPLQTMNLEIFLNITQFTKSKKLNFCAFKLLKLC